MFVGPWSHVPEKLVNVFKYSQVAKFLKNNNNNKTVIQARWIALSPRKIKTTVTVSDFLMPSLNQSACVKVWISSNGLRLTVT